MIDMRELVRFLLILKKSEIVSWLISRNDMKNKEEERRRYEEERNRVLSNKNNHIQESTIFDNIEII
jgi:hypothetical protein